MDRDASTPERALWRAVVARALEDALMLPTFEVDDHPNDHRRKAAAVSARDRRLARAWFERERHRSDFAAVCEWADLDAEAVRRVGLRGTVTT